MFDIKPLDSADISNFNDFYEKNKDVIDRLIISCLESDNVLEEVIKELGYDNALELVNFFKECESNYMVINLSAALETYCYNKENEAFLDLYMAISDGRIDSFLASCDLTMINMLSNNFKDDEVMSLIFPDMRSYILEREKNIQK